MTRVLPRQAPYQGAFSFWAIFSLLFFTVSPVIADSCGKPEIQETARVVAVYDGDTVKLQDGRKLRLLGINTPEVAKKHKPGQAYAEAARRRLTELITRSPIVGLVYGPDREDRYGRQLVYIYNKDNQDIQRILLREGLAAAIAVPPNVAHAQCYLADERSARKARLGMWSGIDYQPAAVENLDTGASGFIFLTGTIARIGKSRKSVWLNLNERVALRVARQDMAYFTEYKPEALQGRKIVARGWLSRYQDQQVMRLRHPSALEFVD